MLYIDTMLSGWRDAASAGNTRLVNAALRRVFGRNTNSRIDFELSVDNFQLTPEQY